jgi:hypothetical protein
MQTARTVEAEWRPILRESLSTGVKDDESSTGRVWAAGFHRVTARSRLAGVLKIMNRLFIEFSIFTRAESVNTEARQYILLICDTVWSGGWGYQLYIQT